MRFELYTQVVLTAPVPEIGLCSGDVVTLVDHHIAPDGSVGYSIEAFNAVGETIGVTCVPEAHLETFCSNEILSVRRLVAA